MVRFEIISFKYIAAFKIFIDFVYGYHFENDDDDGRHGVCHVNNNYILIECSELRHLLTYGIVL